MISEDDFNAFMKALDNPPEPNAALKKLMSSKSQEAYDEGYAAGLAKGREDAVIEWQK